MSLTLGDKTFKVLLAICCISATLAMTTLAEGSSLSFFFILLMLVTQPLSAIGFADKIDKWERHNGYRKRIGGEPCRMCDKKIDVSEERWVISSNLGKFCSVECHDEFGTSRLSTSSANLEEGK